MTRRKTANQAQNNTEKQTFSLILNENQSTARKPAITKDMANITLAGENKNLEECNRKNVASLKT